MTSKTAELEPADLDPSTARRLAFDAIEQGGCVDCRFKKMKAWAPDVDWDALRAELEARD